MRGALLTFSSFRRRAQECRSSNLRKIYLLKSCHHSEDLAHRVSIIVHNFNIVNNLRCQTWLWEIQILAIYIWSRVSQHNIKKIERNIRRCFLHLVQSVHYCGQLQPAAHPLVQIFENLWIFLKIFKYFWVSLQSHNCFAPNIVKACKKQLVCAQYLWGQQETTTWQQTKVMARRKCKARNPLQLERKSKWPKNKLESFSMVLFLPYSSLEFFLGLSTADPLRFSLPATFKFQISWF